MISYFSNRCRQVEQVLISRVASNAVGSWSIAVARVELLAAFNTPRARHTLFVGDGFSSIVTAATRPGLAAIAVLR